MKREQELLIAWKLKDLAAKFESLTIKPRQNDTRKNQPVAQEYGANKEEDK